MAAIQEHLLRHRHAPEAAAHEVDFDDPVPNPSLADERKAAMMVQRINPRSPL